MKGPTPRHARLGGRAALVGFGDATFDAAYIHSSNDRVLPPWVEQA